MHRRGQDVTQSDDYCRPKDRSGHVFVFENLFLQIAGRQQIEQLETDDGHRDADGAEDDAG